jgi:hypothetical protein
MRFITDPGHGWLEVSLVEYPDALVHGTGYGYNAGNGMVYLEEDCEAPAFLKAHPEIDRSSIKSKYYDDDCFVRDLPRIVSLVQ